MKSNGKQFIVPASTRAALICSAAALAALGGRKAWANPGMTNLALDAAAGGNATATATNSDFGSTPGMAIDGDADGNFGDGSVWYGNSPDSARADRRYCRPSICAPGSHSESGNA